MKKGKKGIMVVILALTLVIAGCNTDSTSPPSTTTDTGDTTESIEVGGELKIALNAQPPTLDPMMSTASATRDTGRLVFETLLTTDLAYQPVPMLAESVDTSDDGKRYTFHLRKGVKFHNGKEMTSDDVVASMNRWKENSSEASRAFGDAVFEAEDEYTVVLELPEPLSIALDVMAAAGQFAAIMPEEVFESADVEGVSEYIGTGPFEFVEWVPDQYIHFKKYDDYQPVDFPADGLSGKKEALVDDIYFEIVTDSSTRLAGIQAGQYDIAYQVPFDNYEQLKNESGVIVEAEPTGNLDLVYNKREGLMADVNMRQAVNAALNLDEILQAALVNDEIYEADAGYMNKDIEHWASDAGIKAYNQNDPGRAESFLENAGYNGEEIILMTTRDYEHYYNASVVIKEQLEQIGMTVKLEVYDWPTIVDRREDPKLWHMFVNGFTFKSDPTQLLQLSPGFAGGIDDPTVNSLMDSIRTSQSQDEAKQYWDELQEYAWMDFLPITRLGNYSGVFAMTDKVEGFTISQGPVLWNTTVTQ